VTFLMIQNAAACHLSVVEAQGTCSQLVGQQRPAKSLNEHTSISTIALLAVEFPYAPFSLYRASVPVQGCTYLAVEWVTSL
jgi:hypothetical protein